MAASTTSDVSDGPVLNFINKRLRALRKKLNRITIMEEGIAQGKPINKEQEETLRSKPSIAAAIDELEKLKQPLSVAVNEEVALAIERREADKVNQTLGHDEKEESEQQEEEEEASKVEEVVVEDDKTLVVGDLLKLIYFGSMFDVKSQSDFNSIMLTRAHERECCLAYDYVTDDDSTEMLGERDLDLISAMGSLLISRPGALSLSHQNALQRCIEHAKLWLEKSDQPIDVNSSVTYAGLREKLTKIMGSNYFTITPEMKAPVDVAAAGNYASFQVPAQVDGSVAQYEQKEDGVVDYQGSETYDEQSSPAEEQHKDEYDAENYVETSAAQAAGSEKSHSEAGVEYRDQQQASRRPYQNQRGGGGRSSGGSGGSRRGYSNGGGGRSGGGSGRRGGGGGPYQNGRNQYYDQPGGYHQRNYYNNRGRGGRGPVGNSYNPNAAVAGVNVGET